LPLYKLKIVIKSYLRGENKKKNKKGLISGFQNSKRI
jgi:hypothetical protein